VFRVPVFLVVLQAVDDKVGDESTDEEYTYRITLHSMRDKIQPLTEITIGNNTVTCLFDSGAGVNVPSIS